MKNKIEFKKLKFYLIALLFIPLFSAKCTKKPIEPTPPKTPLEQLPPATQTGANTFGCLVDGEVYIPKGNIYYKAIERPSYFEVIGDLGIKVRNVKDFGNGIGFYIYIYIYI